MTVPEGLRTPSKPTHSQNMNICLSRSYLEAVDAKLSNQLKLEELTHVRKNLSKASKMLTSMAITVNQAVAAVRVKNEPLTSKLWSTYWSNTWKKNFKVRGVEKVRRLKEPLIQESSRKSRCLSLRPLLKEEPTKYVHNKKSPIQLLTIIVRRHGRGKAQAKMHSSHLRVVKSYPIMALDKIVMPLNRIRVATKATRQWLMAV